MRYVLDATAAIAALNDVGSVRARLAAVPASEVGIQIVAVAELLFGACKSSRREENLARIAALKRAVAVLPSAIGWLTSTGRIAQHSRAGASSRAISTWSLPARLWSRTQSS